MLEKFKNVVILAPRTDDGELGCGGTISKLLESGVEVYYIAFSTAHQSLPKHLPKDTLKNELIRSAKVLGIKEKKI